MTTLHDRLADLAEDAPRALPEPGLWDRGVAFRRRRRTATAVVVAVAALTLLALGSATWLRSPAAVEPLPADSPGGMPDRLYPSTSPWLPGTDGAPLGRIAAVLPALRDTWELHGNSDHGVGLALGGVESNGIVGVSATTGAYRFLDLPGLVDPGDETSWSLSPDGRYVAYVYRAADSKAVVSHEFGTEAADGVALYDARTGEVRRHALATENGVAAHGWFWTAPGTVVLDYGNVVDDGGGSDRADPSIVWDVHDERPHELVTDVRTFGIGLAGPGFVDMGTLDGTVRVDPGTGTILRDFGNRDDLPSYGVSDDNGSRVAFVDSSDGAGDPVAVQTIPSDPGQPVTTEHVPSLENALDVFSWIDDDHVAVSLLAGEPDAYQVVIASVDVHTGETQQLVADADYGFGAQFATGLLAEPTVPGIEPPRPLDPRLVAAGGVLVVVAALAALIMWRRRVQP